VVIVICFLLLYAGYARNRGHVLHNKNITQRNAAGQNLCVGR
jgi:hypothetical protein